MEGCKRKARAESLVKRLNKKLWLVAISFQVVRSFLRVSWPGLGGRREQQVLETGCRLEVRLLGVFMGVCRDVYGCLQEGHLVIQRGEAENGFDVDYNRRGY